MVVGTLQQIRVRRDNAAIAASAAVTIIASFDANGLRIDERAQHPRLLGAIAEQIERDRPQPAVGWIAMVALVPILRDLDPR